MHTTLFSAEHFGEQAARNAEVRSHGIADSFSVEATGERRDDAAVQQSFEFPQGILRRDEIEVFLQQGLHQFANPLGLCILDRGGDDAAGAGVELFADGKADWYAVAMLTTGVPGSSVFDDGQGTK